MKYMFVLALAFFANGARAESSVPAKHDRGFSYQHVPVPDVPWSIHILKVERNRRDLEFHTTLARSNAIGMAVVSAQVKTLPPDLGEPIAAVNGDFFSTSEPYPGDPRDLQIREGELVSAPAGHTCFWIDPYGAPHMTNVISHLRVKWPDGASTPLGLNEDRPNEGAILYTSAVGNSTRTSGGSELILECLPDSPSLPLQAGKCYRVKVIEVKNGDSPIAKNRMVLSLGPRARSPKIAPGTIIEISTETSPDLSGVRFALGGGPTLVREGKPEKWNGVQPRHPRSAVGWNKDYYYLVEVDGRQGHLSLGMSFPELSEYMAKIGCEEAMNLDGGGSATFWVLGNVMNSPSEGRERPAANALVVVKKSAKAP